MDAGADPFESRPPTLLAVRRDVRARWEAHPLGTSAPLIRRWLNRFANDRNYVILVSDSRGMLLWVHGIVWRYEPGGRMTVAAFWTRGDRTLPIGTGVKLAGDSVAALVQQSLRPRRLDSYDGLSGPVIDLANTLGAGPRSTVGAPILADGRVWGVIVATRTKGEEFAEDAESRLSTLQSSLR